jgi:hypothetical protein
LAKLDKVIAVQDGVERLISGVYAGKLHPRVAAGLAPLLNLQRRALEATDPRAATREGGEAARRRGKRGRPKRARGFASARFQGKSLRSKRSCKAYGLNNG